MIRPFGIWAVDYMQKILLATQNESLSMTALLLRSLSTLQAFISIGLATISLLALRRRFKLD